MKRNFCKSLPLTFLDMIDNRVAEKHDTVGVITPGDKSHRYLISIVSYLYQCIGY